MSLTSTGGAGFSSNIGGGITPRSKALNTIANDNLGNRPPLYVP